MTPARLLGALIPLLVGCLVLPVQAALYRWIDEQGYVHYSDVIPPASIRQGHTELRKDGIPLLTVPPARTPDQIRAEEKLERLNGTDRAIAVAIVEGSFDKKRMALARKIAMRYASLLDTEMVERMKWPKPQEK